VRRWLLLVRIKGMLLLILLVSKGLIMVSPVLLTLSQPIGNIEFAVVQVYKITSAVLGLIHPVKSDQL
jgi:hypothetical protein